MCDSEEVHALLKRLDTHRFHVRARLQQYAAHGAAYVPPFILLDIRDNRKEIQRVKGVLRAKGIEVEDETDDFETPKQDTVDSTTSAEDEKAAGQPQATNPVDVERLEDLWKEAKRAYEEQEWEEASQLFAQVAAVNPRYKEVQRMLSRSRKQVGLLIEYRRLCALEDGKWREAKRGFELIRIENPDFADRLHLLDWIEEQEWRVEQFQIATDHVDSGETAQARQILIELVNQYPDYRRAVELLEYVIEIEEDKATRQRQKEQTALRVKERQRLEQAHRDAAVRRDAVLIVGFAIIIGLAILIIGFFAR